MIQNFDFRALPVLSPGGEDPSDNETRFRREVERAFRFGDAALQGISKQLANLIGGGPGAGPFLPLAGGTLTGPLIGTTGTFISPATNVTPLTVRGIVGQTVTPYFSIFGSDGNEGFKVWGTSAGSVTINSGSPNIIFEESDQVAPVGRFRVIAFDGALQFQRMTTAPATFNTVFSITPAGTISGDGVTALNISSPVAIATNMGISLGSGTATTPTDVSRHLALYGTTYGLTVTGSRFNYITHANAAHAFYTGSTIPLLIAAASVDVSVPLNTGLLTTTALTVKDPVISPAIHLDCGGFTTIANINTINPSDPLLQTIRIGRSSPAGNINVYVLNPGTTSVRVQLRSEGTGSVIAGVGDFATSLDCGPLTTTGLAKLASVSSGIVELGYASAAQLKMQRTSSLNYLMVPAASNLRVQTTDTSVAWATVASATGWTAGSDQRLKKDIVPLDYGLAEIMRLRPKRFRWRADNRLDIGLIGQQVRRIIPEAVVVYPNDPDMPNQIRNMLGMHKDALIPVLINAVQELATQLKRLEAKIAKA